MSRRIWRRSALALVLAAACTDVTPTAPHVKAMRPLLNVSGPSTGRSFCSSALINIPATPLGSGPADVFPSTVTVQGAASADFKVTVTLRGLTHTFASDIDMVLVGPNGTAATLLSDAGGATDFRNSTITFDDAASSFVPRPETEPFVIPDGSYMLTNFGADDPSFPGGPPGPYNSFLSVFEGANPNGVWNLYIWDDLTLDDGLLANGWCVTITSANESPVADPGGPYSADEGSPITFDAAASSDDGSIASYEWSFGDGSTATGKTAQHTYANDGNYTVKLVVTDDEGVSSEATTTAIVANVAPVVTAITLPSNPIAVGTSITIGASFTDVGTADTHTASFDLDGGGTTTSATVAESDGSGAASATVTFTQPGVYTIRATITDDDASASRSSTADVPAYVVVYDPITGFVTGGGWIVSPAGALASNPAASGTATFGFVAKYQTGSSVPTGNTKFQFRVGELHFASTHYDWLVVAGGKAKYKGAGTINGEGSYGFMLTAVDGGIEGGTGDGFRIRIWNLATGLVLYDNLRAASLESYSSTALGGGSVVIHK